MNHKYLAIALILALLLSLTPPRSAVHASAPDTSAAHTLYMPFLTQNTDATAFPSAESETRPPLSEESIDVPELNRRLTLTEPDEAGLRYVVETPLAEQAAVEKVEPERVDVPERLKLLHRALSVPMEELRELPDPDIRQLFIDHATELEIDIYARAEDGALRQVADGLTRARARQAEVVEPAATQNFWDPNNYAHILDRITWARDYMNVLSRGYASENRGFAKEYSGYPLWLSIDGWSTPNSPRLAGHYYDNRQQPYMQIGYAVIGSNFELMDQSWEAGFDWSYGEPYLWADRYYYDYNPQNLGQTVVSYQISVRSHSGMSAVDLWFDQTKILDNIGTCNCLPYTVNMNYSHVNPHVAAFPAHRYTFRHATKLGANLKSITGDIPEYHLMWNTLTQHGFWYDLYDPLFGLSSFLHNDWHFTSAAYPECNNPAHGALNNPYPWPGSAATWTYYMYESKVCTLGVNAYIELSKVDYLVPVLQAIHILLKTDNPDHAYCRPYTGGCLQVTPRVVARQMESSAWNGYGIKVFGKNSAYASSVRTNAFLVLETLLGYRYGDMTSQWYADQTAEVLLNTLWGVAYDWAGGPGLYYGDTVEHSLILRPQYTGGQLLSWTQSNPLPYGLPPKTFLSDVIDHWSMPDEVEGLIPTNAESTGTFIQALRVYTRYKHNIVWGAGYMPWGL